ncbi:GerW family sporulation protein [Maribacter aquimaris]|uniref:GerW family sporulation protein n=1 Tax=Maribacter aquimaris TaxID=2737171 RepID=UPI003742E457
MGFGSGRGEGTKGQGMGAGATVDIEPISFLVTIGDQISFLKAGKSHGLATAFKKVPGLIEIKPEIGKPKKPALKSS